MRNLITAAIIACTATSAHAMDADKQGHLAAGVAVGAIAYAVTPWLEEITGRDLVPVNVACGASAAAGLAKEAYDASGRGNVEFADFAATAATWCAAAGVRWFVTAGPDRIRLGVNWRF